MRTAVAALALFLAVDLQAALVAGPERPVSPPNYGIAYGRQYLQDLVSDGTDYLALWIDQTEGRQGLYAAVVDDRGATRPTPPRRLVNGYVFTVKAVWTGDAYLVAWADPYRNAIVAARVSRDGELLSEPFEIASKDVALLTLAWNGRTAMVLAYHTAAYEAITFTTTGAIIRTETLPAAHTESYRAAATAVGERFIAFWFEMRFAEGKTFTTIKAMRFDRDGAPLDMMPATVVADLPHYVEEMSAASDGQRAALALVGRRNTVDSPNSFRAYTFDPRTQQTAEHFARSTSGDTPQVIATSRGFVAALLAPVSGKTELVLAPFDGIQSDILIADTAATWLRVAASDHSALAVWSDYRLKSVDEYSNLHMFGLGLDASATTATREVLPVAMSAVAQVSPVIAPAGDRALVVWTDLTTTEEGEVLAVRVDSNGVVMDPAPIHLGHAGRYAFRQSVVFTGEVWLVAVAGAIRKISLEGKLSGEIDAVGSGVRAFATNGEVTVLAAGKSLYRFTPEGVRRDQEPLSATDVASVAPVLASNGRDFLFAWTEGSDYWQWPSPNYIDVRAVMLDRNGVPFGPVIDLARTQSNEHSPFITGNNGEFLVLYQHNDDVRTKRVLREGTVIDGAVVALEARPLAVAAMGKGYIALIEDAAGLSLVELDAAGAPAAAAAIARTDAQAIDADAGSSNGTAWIAYNRTVAGPAFENIERVFVRTLHEVAPKRRAIR